MELPIYLPWNIFDPYPHKKLKVIILEWSLVCTEDFSHLIWRIWWQYTGSDMPVSTWSSAKKLDSQMRGMHAGRRGDRKCWSFNCTSIWQGTCLGEVSHRLSGVQPPSPWFFMVFNHQLFPMWAFNCRCLGAVQHGWSIEVGIPSNCTIIYAKYRRLRPLDWIQHVFVGPSYTRIEESTWSGNYLFCIPSHMDNQHGQHLSCSPYAKSLLCSGIPQMDWYMWGTTSRSNGLYVGRILVWYPMRL